MHHSSAGPKVGAGGGLMVSSKAMGVVRQIYDWVESALWAALLAFVIYFLVNVVPILPEMTRRAESTRSLKIAAENRSYCEKWGMKSGTREYSLCTIDLQQLRKSIERDLSDEGVF